MTHLSRRQRKNVGLLENKHAITKLQKTNKNQNFRLREASSSVGKFLIVAISWKVFGSH